MIEGDYFQAQRIGSTSSKAVNNAGGYSDTLEMKNNGDSALRGTKQLWGQFCNTPVSRTQQSSDFVEIKVADDIEVNKLIEHHIFNEELYQRTLSAKTSTVASFNQDASIEATSSQSELLQASEETLQCNQLLSKTSLRCSNDTNQEQHHEQKIHQQEPDLPLQKLLSTWNFNRHGLNNDSVDTNYIRYGVPSNEQCQHNSSSNGDYDDSQNRKNKTSVSDINDSKELKYSQRCLLHYRQTGQKNRKEIVPIQLIECIIDSAHDCILSNSKIVARQVPLFRSSSTRLLDDNMGDWRVPDEHDPSLRNDFTPLLRGIWSSLCRQEVSSNTLIDFSDERDQQLRYDRHNSFADTAAVSTSYSTSNNLFQSRSLDRVEASENYTHNLGTLPSRCPCTGCDMRACSDDNVVGPRSKCFSCSENYGSLGSCREHKLYESERLYPFNAAAFSLTNLGVSNCDYLFPVRRCILPFGHPNFFQFLKTLPQNEFLYLARSVARYRRTSRLDFTPSTIVSINLCSCCSPHTSPVIGLNFQTDFWSHKVPPGSILHGALDTSLSVMLVELHPELEVAEFLDHRLPAVIRQHVGNRLDRNFVVQIFGISFLRQHLAGIWTIGDLPECTVADMRRLSCHPLYHHMLHDINNRQQVPVFRNLNLCPIQYCNSRLVSGSHGSTLQQSFAAITPSNLCTKPFAAVSSSTSSTACSSSEAIRSSNNRSSIDTSCSSSQAVSTDAK